jgi:uncharacterized protein
MNLQSKMKEDLKVTMKDQDSKRRDVLRLLITTVKQEETKTQSELPESEIVNILRREAEKWREAINEMENTGHSELADEKRFELSVIETYLPRQLSREEIEALVREAIQVVGAMSPCDAAKVMKQIMPTIKGQADSKLVIQIMRDLLSQQRW